MEYKIHKNKQKRLIYSSGFYFMLKNPPPTITIYKT